MQYILITGASKGFGKELAIQLAQSPLVTQNPTHMILCSRSQSLLSQVKQQILESHIPSQVPFHVIVHPVDFSRLNLEAVCNQLLQGSVPEMSSVYERAYLFNNAGTLGKLARGRNVEFKDIQESMHTNVVAPMVLTYKFLKAFGGRHQQATIVNISSLAAIEPFDCWSLYCTGKAARDMFHRCIALEEELIQTEESRLVRDESPEPDESIQSILPDRPSVSDPVLMESNTESTRESHAVNISVSTTVSTPINEPAISANTPMPTSRIRILNYAPGPLNTDMQTQIREEMPNVPLRNVFENMHSTEKLISPAASVKVLLGLLVDNGFENGSHIDYYDVYEKYSVSSDVLPVGH